MPPRNRPPNQLPPAVRDHPAVIAACQQRDLGRLFRTVNNLTEEPERFTATHLGILCQMPTTRVQDYMRGKHATPALDTLTRVADGLRIPGHRLGLAPRPWERAAPGTQPHNRLTDPPPPAPPTGPTIRHLRLAQGKTQAVIAGLAGIETKHYARIERGTRTPSLTALHNIARALDTTASTLLGEPQPARDTTDHPQTNQHTPTHTPTTAPPPRTPGTLLRQLLIERRWRTYDAFRHQYEKTARHLAASGQAEPTIATHTISRTQYERWLRGDIATKPHPTAARILEHLTGYPIAQLLAPPPHPGQQPHTISAATPHEANPEASTLLSLTLGPSIAENSPPGHRIGQETIDQLRERAMRMRRLDDFLGGADTYRLYSVELAETTRLINDHTYTESIGKALLSIAAEQAQQAGWAAFDAGNHDAARQLYESSMASAQLAGDNALIGNALSMLSYQLISTAKSGVAAASASCDWTQDSSNAVRALMLERRAFAYANAGDERQTEVSLTEAEDLLYRDTGREEPHWVSWADRKEFQLIYGRCWAELHRPLRAVPILESVLAEFDDSEARNKAVYLTWLASAYIDAGEIEQAVTTLGRSLDLSVGIASARPAQRVALLAQRLTAHRKLSSVTDLLDRISGPVTAGLPQSL